MKLQIKLPLLLILMVLVIGIISGIGTDYFHRQNSVTQFEQTAAAMAKTVQGSLEQGMMLGETQHMQEALKRIGEDTIINNVTLFDPEGNITASSRTEQIGQLAPNDEVYQTLLSGEPRIWTENKGNDGEAIIISTPVMNKEECQLCHSSESRILGVIQVGFDTAILANQTRQEAILVIIMVLVAFVVAGGGMAFAMKRMALDPLSRLAYSARKLSEGDYTARAENRSKDEIGTLATTFNEMAENIEQRTRELAEWNAGLEDKVHQRTRELTTINAIITAVSQSLNLERILNDTLTTIIRELGIEAGMVHLLSAEGDRLSLAAQEGFAPEYAQAMSVIKRKAQKSGKKRRAANVSKDFEIRAPEEESEFSSFVSLPLMSKNQTLGTLSLASRTADRFDPETMRMLNASAEALAIAIENARTAQYLREARSLGEQLMDKLITAQEEERRRIARELHDDASQSLAALALNLEDISDSLPKDYSEIRKKLAVLKQRAVETLGGIRNLALELRPSALDDLGLVMAIDWYAKDYLGKRGLETDVKVVGHQRKLPSYTETMLFRIIQEALTNVVKHAEATHVKVQLYMEDGLARIRIEDNGKGFDVEAAMSRDSMRNNLGIHGMAERTALLGGSFNIRSEPGNGTYLSVEVPLAREESADE